MDTPVFSKDPPRLIDEGGTVGRLIESAEPAFHEGLSVSHSWRKLEQKLDNPGRRRGFRLLPLALAFAAAALAALWLKPRPARTPLALTAEPIALSAKAPSLAPPVLDAKPSPPVQDSEPAPKPTLVASAAPRPVLDELPSSDVACNALAASKPERGVDCFLALAAGSGVQAEVALYQALRLSAGELHNPQRALELAEQYRARFPDGAMRGEVSWVRVESLDRAGRADEALAESEALLGTPLGRALAPKLHFLRGHVYAAERGDCASAISEYVSLVGAPGKDADTAELERASCLERLGQSADARAAYQQYLKRPDARDPARAKARLDDLGTSAAEPQRVP